MFKGNAAVVPPPGATDDAVTFAMPRTISEAGTVALNSLPLT
jgi:hypothetical protein